MTKPDMGLSHLWL